MTETTISQYFADDHDRLDELFRQYLSLKATEPGPARQRFLEFKVGLERHIGWEEGILFPLFESRTGMHDSGPTVVMRLEHQEIKRLLNAIDARLLAGQQLPEREESDLVALLETHNWKEEHILYPAIDQHVTAEERRQVVLEMDPPAEGAITSGSTDGRG